jgi:hypothetical protein
MVLRTFCRPLFYFIHFYVSVSERAKSYRCKLVLGSHWFDSRRDNCCLALSSRVSCRKFWNRISINSGPRHSEYICHPTMCYFIVLRALWSNPWEFARLRKSDESYCVSRGRCSVVGWGTATRLKVTGSIPSEVVGIFSLPNPSSRAMALGSTQFLTEISTRNLRESKGLPASAQTENLTDNCEPMLYKNVGASTSHNHMGFHGLLQE